jgi:hypothetical protein
MLSQSGGTTTIELMSWSPRQSGKTLAVGTCNTTRRSKHVVEGGDAPETSVQCSYQVART